MKKGIIFLICLMCVIMFAGINHAGEVITGKILEGDPDKSMIQVGNRNYIVEMVLVDTGSEEPVLGGFSDLKVGSFVEVYAGNKEPSGFWRAEKVVVYIGSEGPPEMSDD